MPNPYAPVSIRRGSAEVVDQLPGFLTRLRALGATDAEVAAVEQSWGQFDDDWGPADQAAMVAWPDTRLRDELLAIRQEYRENTTTDAEAAAQADTAAADVAEREAAERIGGNVKSLLDWVGTDGIRAVAVLNLELSPDGGKRTTLVKPLQELLGVDTSEA